MLYLCVDFVAYESWLPRRLALRLSAVVVLSLGVTRYKLLQWFGRVGQRGVCEPNAR